MPDANCQLGVYGLATMGANLSRNAARRGYRVGLYNRHNERTDRLIKQHGTEGAFIPAHDLNAFVSSLKRPRAADGGGRRSGGRGAR